MWFTKSNRKKLLDILTGNGISTLTDYVYSDIFPTIPISQDDFYLIWENDPQELRRLPIIIIVADGQLRDFLAWVITYFQNYRPFTAYFRVVEFTTILSLNNWFSPPALGRLETACVGLIISETNLLSSLRDKPLQITPLNCMGTISYILSRALALGANLQHIDYICEQWSVIRRLTEQPYRKIETESVKTIFKILLSIGSNNLNNKQFDSKHETSAIITSACLEIMNEGRVSNSTWRNLTKDVGFLHDAHEAMESAREDRVRYFERLLTDNSKFKFSNSSLLHEFIFGYLGSLIGPGTLTYTELVFRHAASFPTILLWYGLCAGLQKKNELLSSYNVLGRRIARELLRYESLLRPPDSDIAFSELQVLFEGDVKVKDFLTYTSTRVIIEILPCISTNLVWTTKDSKQQIELFPQYNETRETEKLFIDLGNHLMSALNIHRTLIEPLNERKYKEHPQNYKTKRKKNK